MILECIWYWYTKQRQLRWRGRLYRMDNNRQAKRFWKGKIAIKRKMENQGGREKTQLWQILDLRGKNWSETNVYATNTGHW